MAGWCRNVGRGMRLTRYFSSSPVSPPGRCARYEQLGNPIDVVRVDKCPGRPLESREVCVKMLAAPINPSDINRIEGVYPVRPVPPAIGGGEGVGEVLLVGSEVQNLSVGDWVIPSSSGIGTWSTHVLGEESAWLKVPHDVPVEYLATISVNPCTAFRMLEDFSTLEPGDVVVQNGATSMVGQCVIQLARAKGAQTINLVRERAGIEDAKKHLLDLGAEKVVSIEEAKSSSTKEVLAGLPAPKLGLNCVGGAAAAAVMQLLGPSGTMVTYGGMSKKPFQVSTTSFIFKDHKLRGFWLQKWRTEHTQEEFASMVLSLIELIQAGKLKYNVEKISFNDFNSALENAMNPQGGVPKQVLLFD